MAESGAGDPSRVAPAERKAHQRSLTSSILVVDDDPVVLAVVARVLRRAGADVTATSSGREAIRAIADGEVRPNILLSDIDMPKMNGIELAARIRSMRPEVAVLLMTGNPQSADAARAHPDQVLGVLLKPVTVDDLLAEVRRAEEHSRPGRPQPRRARR
jgi:CheY-like chemotaxis protein